MFGKLLNIFRKPDKKWNSSTLHPVYSKIITDGLDSAEYTPDVAHLSQYETQLIFLYDNLMKNRCEHSRIANHSEEMWTAYTKDKYSMWIETVGTNKYPVIVDDPKSSLAPPCVVRGKVYSIGVNKLIELDKDRKNGYNFVRKRIPVQILVRKMYNSTDEVYSGGDWRTIPAVRLSDVETHEKMVWCYLGHRPYFEHRMSGFNGYKPASILDSRNPEVGKFYYFKNG